METTPEMEEKINKRRKYDWEGVAPGGKLV